MGEISQKRISAKRLQRLRQIDLLLARGGLSLDQIAEKLDLDPNLVAREREWIQANWWISREQEKTDEKRQLRLRELQYIKDKALESFDISRQVTIETTYEDVECEECQGTGIGTAKDGKCLSCNGNGFTTEEKSTTIGKPGDVAFLNAALSVLKEMSRLEALYKQPVTLIRHQLHGEIEHNHTTNNLDLSDASPELVLEAMTVFNKLEEERKKRQEEAVLTEDTENKKTIELGLKRLNHEENTDT